MSTKHINKNKKTALIIYKNNGKFYNVFDIDAYIFNILFNYKVINNKAGFPESRISRQCFKQNYKYNRKRENFLSNYL